MTQTTTIDFETRSPVKLGGKEGVSAHVYAEHPDTDIMCLAVMENDNTPFIWVPEHFRYLLNDSPFHSVQDWDLLAVMDRAGLIEAHNCSFEQLMWFHIMFIRWGYKDLPMEKLRCSAAIAASYNLPRGLGKVCEALDLGQQKSKEGHNLMMKMCKPRKLVAAEVKGSPYELIYDSKPPRYIDHSTGKEMYFWHEKPKDFEGLCSYCMQDIRAERSLSKSLYPLSISEQRVWQLDMQINNRGYYVAKCDIENLKAKVKVREVALLEQVQVITEGVIVSTRQTEKTKAWLASKGTPMGDMKIETVTDALKIEGIHPKAKKLLEVHQSLSKSSVKKLDKMLTWSCGDSRIKGTLMYHGAGPGRWTARGPQPHNNPRDTYPEENINGLLSLDDEMLAFIYGCAIKTASKCLRGMLTAPPGKILCCADFSAIEAVCLAWMSGQEQDLAAFRNKLDLYRVTAMDIYPGVKYDGVNFSQRLVGKTAVLALGYQGWVNAFKAFAVQYGVSFPEEERDHLTYQAEEWARKVVLNQDLKKKKKTTEEQEKAIRIVMQGPTDDDLFEEWAKPIIMNWRLARPNVTNFWKGVESAAIQAITTGKSYAYGRVTFGMRGRFLHCRLPSGRLLSYCDPYVKDVVDKYNRKKKGIRFMGVGKPGTWEKQFTYGGKLTENIIQGIARDLLSEAIIRVEKAGYPVCLHVHDEIIAELVANHKEPLEWDAKKKVWRPTRFEAIMSQLPVWAVGCPVSAAGWVGTRYRK